MATITETEARAQLVKDFSAMQIAGATRRLSVARYAQAYKAGRDRDTYYGLDETLERYMSRGPKTMARESAYLDGNTWSDETAEEHIRNRINNPEGY